MIVLECANQDGTTYFRGVMVVSIHTVTADEDSEFTWMKFWDGVKMVNFKTTNSPNEIAHMVKQTRERS